MYDPLVSSSQIANVGWLCDLPFRISISKVLPAPAALLVIKTILSALRDLELFPSPPDLQENKKPSIKMPKMIVVNIYFIMEVKILNFNNNSDGWKYSA